MWTLRRSRGLHSQLRELLAMKANPSLPAVALVLVLSSQTAEAQNGGNDSPFNNGGDVVFFYSDPSSGATSGASPADCTGDLYWRTHTGPNFLNDVDATVSGSKMEIDGYHEYLYDTDWTTT